VIDYITYTKVLVDRVTAEADAFKPGLSAVMMSGNAITVYIISDFVVGILLVWTYAAIRRDSDPGPRLRRPPPFFSGSSDRSSRPTTY